MFFRRLLWCALVASLFWTGCGKQTPERAPALALYGEPTGVASTSIPKLRSPVLNSNWENAGFACVQTELSPATLYHSSSNYFGLFRGMTNSGLGAPSYLALPTPQGPKIFRNGTNIQASLMEECWLLVWFEGAKGWTNWDSPWAVFLQHKPKALKLNADGLHLDFPGAAGDVVMMPLSGYFKPSLTNSDYLALHHLPAKKIKTFTWSSALPKDPLMRTRYWASAMREFPLYCEDTFSIDRAQDTVTIRQRFQWHSIRDDWNTQPLKLAPVSPALGQASLDKTFPATFSKIPVNLEIFTPAGPCLAVENVDSYDVTLKLLQYVNETEASDPISTNVPAVVQAALDKLQKTAQDKFRDPNKYEYDHGGLNNFCWAIQGDQWYARALPYMDAQTRSNAVTSLRKYFRDDVLVTNRFKAREYPKGSGQEFFILEGPGIGSWGILGDPGKFSANMLETVWAYAHYTGDWELIRERWPLIKKLFVTPAETRWAGFGRDAIAELGDEAPPCLAMARLAYKVGDMDTYNYAAQMYARELVHHFLKQKGADYFRKNQPYHSMEFMDEEVYLTNLWGDTAGWQIDGPSYPSKADERQFNNRWVRFKDADTARFYRELLSEDVRREMDRLEGRWDAKRKYVNDSQGMPSLVQLRSLLLNESPAALARLASPDQFSGPPSGIIGSCWSVLRTSHPTRYERLIPAGAASPFVTGLERSVAGPNPGVVQSILTSDEQSRSPTWPLVSWWKSWKTPTNQRWNFGYVMPTRVGSSLEPKPIPLNWNTVAVVYSNEK
ncbi:MAG TPA: hypothetical protein VMZ27_08510 [Candidatus Saccharimonadales bacterium]|nr:hypothetical protein [Candidatus Saccharimonadales bacterium]